MLKLAFPDVVGVIRPTVTNKKICNGEWVAGFTSAEGCFFINTQAKNAYSLGFQVILVFQLTQHSRDEKLMRSLIEYFDCGNILQRGEAFDFRVTKLSDIENKIIPFFKKFQIYGVKALDFADFMKVADLMKNKKHLTKKGLEQIRNIKAGMNTGRK